MRVPPRHITGVSSRYTGLRTVLLLALLLLLIVPGSGFSGLKYAYLAVHCEPVMNQQPPKTPAGELNITRPQSYWNDLVLLVNTADAYSVKLTIMLTPQWACYAGLDPSRRDLLKQWEAAGHEIALHHHGLGAYEFSGNWDGYTNDPVLTQHQNFIGSVEQMMQHTVYTERSILSATTEDGDWPPGILYLASGGREKYNSVQNPGDIVAAPELTAYAGQAGGYTIQLPVWHFRMRHFTDTPAQVTALNELNQALSDFQNDPGDEKVLGFVTHVYNFKETSGEGRYEEFFSSLNQAGVSMLALKDLASALNLDDPEQPELYTGWWWSPPQGGSGLSMQMIDDELFLAWYVYDASGRPYWYVSRAKKQAPRLYAGTIKKYSGPPLGTPHTPVSESSVGSLTLLFSSTDAASMEWTLNSQQGSMNIVKYMDEIADGLEDSRALSGWWWDPAAAGTGFFLEAQGNTLFGAWYHYREDGSPCWRTFGGYNDVGGFPDGTLQYSSALYEYSGGTVPGSAYSAPLESEAGPISLLFTPEGDIRVQWTDETYTLVPYASTPETGP